jgi:hypothetical protein
MGVSRDAEYNTHITCWQQALVNLHGSSGILSAKQMCCH